MRKVLAFTIMEATVGLLLSAIVIAMAYQGFTIFQRLHHRFTQEAAIFEVEEQGIFTLRKELLNADSVLKTGNGLSIYLDNRVITYAIEDSLVLRNGKDTLLNRIGAATYYWNRQEQFVPNFPIDAIQLKLLLASENLEVNMKTHYTAAEYLKLEQRGTRYK